MRERPILFQKSERDFRKQEPWELGLEGKAEACQVSKKGEECQAEAPGIRQGMWIGNFIIHYQADKELSVAKT